MLGSLIKDLFARRHAESQGVGNTATGSKGELSSSNPRPMRCEIVRPAANSPLLQYRNNVTSQCGEDGIIAHVLDVIRPTHNYCIEFGAWDGKYLSNCYNLLTNAGWSGLMIEGASAKCEALRSTFRGNDRVLTLNRMVEVDGADSIDNILKEVGAPKEPGVMSIDIDGNDYYVFESLSEHRPELIIVEFNPTVPNDVIFIQEKNIAVHQGCSLLALIGLARDKGYELAVSTPINAFFVRADKFPLLGVADNSISNLYRPAQDGRIFQGYDSTIHVVGMDRLWTLGTPVCSEDFQVVPRAMRRWQDTPVDKRT